MHSSPHVSYKTELIRGSSSTVSNPECSRWATVETPPTDRCTIRVVVAEEHEFLCLEGVSRFSSVCAITSTITCSEWRFKPSIFSESNVACYCCRFVVKSREKERSVSDTDLIVSNWNFCFWMPHLLGFRMVEFYAKHDHAAVWTRSLTFRRSTEALMVFKSRMATIVPLEVSAIIAACATVGSYFLHYGFCMISLSCTCKWRWYTIMNWSLKTSVNGFAARTKLCSFLQDLAALLLRRVASADMLRQPTISLCDQETCSVTFSHPRGIVANFLLILFVKFRLWE